MPAALPLSPSARHRWMVASRALAAIGGGYVLAALSAAALAVSLPLARVDATLTATMLSFLVYACAVVWVFAARTAGRAWLGLLVPSLALGLAVWLQRLLGAA
ncbi:MAG: DUF3649 domain-containing protein [Aquabacterium sp.]|uniref:DUF3649 domain-containing protein n=1 Tax=Aquabacterium sp. TaxID=1872578 RepID=UPI003BAEE8A9